MSMTDQFWEQCHRAYIRHILMAHGSEVKSRLVQVYFHPTACPAAMGTWPWIEIDITIGLGIDNTTGCDSTHWGPGRILGVRTKVRWWHSSAPTSTLYIPAPGACSAQTLLPWVVLRDPGQRGVNRRQCLVELNQLVKLYLALRNYCPANRHHFSGYCQSLVKTQRPRVHTLFPHHCLSLVTD